MTLSKGDDMIKFKIYDRDTLLNLGYTVREGWVRDKNYVYFDEEKIGTVIKADMIPEASISLIKKKNCKSLCMLSSGRGMYYTFIDDAGEYV
jgi:hypothetical protein